MTDSLDDDNTRLSKAVESKQGEKIEEVEDKPGDQTSIDDPLFEYSEGLFKKKEMVRVGWVPDGSRIVGRSDYINLISTNLNDAVFGEAPNHIAITGKTGTGKSLVSRFVSQRAKSAAVDTVEIGVSYVDCSEATTVTQLLSHIGRELNDPSFYETKSEAITMPGAGLSKNEFYRRFWDILNHYDSTILILDEVDMLTEETVLMNFAKAVEKQATNCNIGIVAISNVIGYFEELSPRTKSVFQAEEVIFDPYDANQLTNILEGRRDAYRDGVLSDDVIPLVAALSAQEHGDARKAMRLFRKAGEIAEIDNSSQVKERHVRAAQTQLEKEKFRDFLDGTTTHMKAITLVLAVHMEYQDESYIRTGVLYESYGRITKQANISTISIRRVREILREMGLHRVVESRIDTSGPGEPKEHRLLHSTDAVIESIFDDGRFEDLRKEDITDIVKKTIRNS